MEAKFNSVKEDIKDTYDKLITKVQYQNKGKKTQTSYSADGTM